MKEMTIEEHKQTALQILIHVAQFCEQHGLRYFLAYGTLIGAIRHQGFIPWDDDIDIHMPRDDYEKFIAKFNELSEWNNLRAVSPYDPISKHTFTKVMDTNTVKIEQGIDYQDEKWGGVDIDIFPLDGQPLDENKFIRLYKKKKRLYLYHYLTIRDPHQGSLKIRAASRLAKKLFRKDKILKKAEKLSTKYSYEISKYVGSNCSLYNSIKDRYEKECFSDYCYKTFENTQFRVPIKYDLVLKTVYGNYMQLPPIEEQTTHHSNKVFYKTEGITD